MIISNSISNTGNSFGIGSGSETSYSAESTAVFDKMDGLTTTQKNHMSRFIDRQTANGNASLLSSFQCYAVSGNETINWFGTPTATIIGGTIVPGYGVTLDGVDDYINTGFNPSIHGGSNFTLNDSFAGVFLKKNTSTGVGGLLGAMDGASNRWTLTQNNNVAWRANTATAGVYVGETAFLSGSLYCGVRSPSLTGMMINTRLITGSNTTTTALANLPFYIGAANNLGTLSIWMQIDVGCFVAGKYVGFKFQEFYNDLIIMLIGLEGVAYPDWVQLGIELGGQSNAVGQTEDLPSAENIGPITFGTSPIRTAYMKTAGSLYPVLQFTTDPGTRTNRGQIFGVELTLAKYILSATNKDLYMGKTAYGGAPVSAEVDRQDFNIASNELYLTLRDEIKELSYKIHSLGKAPLIVLVWIQGERDTLNDTFANAWSTEFGNIINQLATDGAGIQYTVINKLSSLIADGVDPGRLNIVRNQQQLYKDTHTNTFIVDMTPFSLSVDGVHFNGAGYEAAGTEYGTTIVSNILT